MKPYLLFAGHDYYPKGGLLDLKGDFDTIEEAVQYYEDHRSFKVEYYDKELHWFHVVDRNTLEIVAEKAPYS